MNLSSVKVDATNRPVVTLDIEVATDEVERVVSNLYSTVRRTVKVPGFRPGKAPREVLRQRLGLRAIRQEMADRLTEPAYREAIAQTNLRPLRRARVEVVSAKEDAPFRFKASVLVEPEVELGQYSGVRARRHAVEIKEEWVEAALDRALSRFSSLRPVTDRGARDGDSVEVELEFLRGTGPRVLETETVGPFLLGRARFTPDFQPHLYGARVGEQRDFALDFPEDSKSRKFAGRRMSTRATVTALAEVVKPELTDVFAQGLGLESAQQFRERTEEAVRKAVEEEADRAFREAVVKAAVDQAEVDIPGDLVEECVKDRIAGLTRKLDGPLSDEDIEEVLRLDGSSATEVRERLAKEERFNIKRGLVLREVARRENLALEPGEIEAALRDLRGSVKDPDKSLAGVLDSEGGKATMERLLLERKAADWLAEHAITCAGDNVVAAGTSREDPKEG